MSQALDIQGHRGARGLAPENTLHAFARALGIGVTTLELDVGVTRDGVVVVSHDRALNPDLARGPGGRWLARRGRPIWGLTWAELQRYDIGRLNPVRPYAARWPAQQAVDGARIPRLSDVFELVRKSGNETVRFNIETKLSPLAPRETPEPRDFARRLIAVVRDAGMAGRTTVQSFDWRTLEIVQAEAPEIPTVYLTVQTGASPNISAAGDSPWTAGYQFRDHGSVPRMVKAAGGAVWSPDYADLTRPALQEAQALGLRVVVWTVNAPPDMHRLIEWGVDGIISDRPDILRQVASERGIALPPATRVTP